MAIMLHDHPDITKHIKIGGLVVIDREAFNHLLNIINMAKDITTIENIKNVFEMIRDIDISQPTAIDIKSSLIKNENNDIDENSVIDKLKNLF